jgi:hypothetical protein
VLEDRYERLDNGTQLNRAHLRPSWRGVLHRTNRASTVAPYAGGIHRISNPTSRPAVSVHLYGPRMGSLDGRDYDPSHDYVCDRYEGERAIRICASSRSIVDPPLPLTRVRTRIQVVK